MQNKAQEPRQLRVGGAFAVVFGLLLAFVVAGCQVVDPLPDPNDPTQVGILQPEVLRRNLRAASDAAMLRVVREEITESEAQKLVQEYAERSIGSIDLDHIPDVQAWEYAEVFLAAKNWPLARAALIVAVKNTNGEDRRVNDTLRLATAEAHLGNVKEALTIARTVFDTPDPSAAPILLAVLYEITPPSRAKGQDIELAKLIEDAITQHQRVRVNRRSDAGRAFLQARPYHIRRAWQAIFELYEAAGRKELAEEARKRSATMLGKPR